MIRKNITPIALLLFFLCSTGSWAQIAPVTVTVEDMETPSFPAAAVLGSQPAAVEKPVTPRKIALSLLSGFMNQSEYALEMAPAWLSNPVDSNDTSMKVYQTKSYSDYYETGNQLWDNLAFSLIKGNVAAAGTTQSGTALAFGLRTLLILSDEFNDAANAVQTLEKKVADDAANNSPNYVQDREALDQAVKNLSNARENPNFTLEPAVGAEDDFLMNDLNNGVWSKVSAWLTADYCKKLSDTNKLDLITVYRYTNMLQPSQGIQDWGGRIRLQLDEFGLSAEIVKRWGYPDSYRADGILQYALSTDIYITGTFGQDFATTTTTSPLLAILGVNFAFGATPQITSGNS